MNELINLWVQNSVDYSNTYLMPLMLFVFIGAIFIRSVIYFTVKSEYQFAIQLEKRVHKYLSRESGIEEVTSFHQLVKRILENTYYEHFELKRKYRRRRYDHVTTITDRLFLIQDGVAHLIADALSQTRYLRKSGKSPKFLDISKYVFQSNPVFNRVMGIFPMGIFNDVLNILPGLFVVGGIFGTFVGVMQALPQLSHLDPNNQEATKIIMDKFLLNMAFSMGTSIAGIIYSVSLTILNATFSPDSIYINMVNKFTSSLEFLWNDTETNESVGDSQNYEDRRGLSFSNSSSSNPTDKDESSFNELIRVRVPDGKIKQEVLASSEKRMHQLEEALRMIRTERSLTTFLKKRQKISPEDWKKRIEKWIEQEKMIEEKMAELRKSKAA